MTTDALGPCPSRNEREQLMWDMRDVSRDTGEPRRQFKERVVPAEYADWQRRRAERAEELLRDAMSLHCLQDPYEEVEELRGRVAAHFASVKEEKP